MSKRAFGLGARARGVFFVVDLMMLDGTAVAQAQSQSAPLSSARKLSPESPGKDDGFGIAVELENGLAAVGAADAEREGNFAAGYVTVFRRSAQGDWQRGERLDAGAQVGEQAFFGAAFDLARDARGETLVVGASGEGNGKGAVYVFERKGTESVMTRKQRIVPESPEEFEAFGYAIELQGNTLVVGAPGNSDTQPESGACYVYGRDNADAPWSLVQRFKAPQPELVGDFCASVALQGDLLVVGAPLHEGGDRNQTDKGAVFIYRRGANQQWTLVTEIGANPSQIQERFGRSVLVVDDQIVVGATRSIGRRNERPVANAGALYFFDLNGQRATQTQKFQLSPSPTDTYFGFDLAGSDGRIVVGTSRRRDRTALEGRAYVMQKDPQSGEWAVSTTLVADASNDTDDLGFGTSVAMDQNTVLVGAPYGLVQANPLPREAGYVAHFELEPLTAPLLPFGALVLFGGGLVVLRRRA